MVTETHPGMRMPSHALVLEDPDSVLISFTLERMEGVFSTRVTTLDAAKHTLEHDNYDVALVDLSLSDHPGPSVLQELAKVGPDVPMVAFTDHEDEKLGARALAAGAIDYLEKENADPQHIRRVLRFASVRSKQLVAQRQNAVLLQRNAELHELDQARNQFVNILAHELRTPLHAIVGYCELIHAGSYGEMNGQQIEAMSGVVRRGRDLIDLLENVLNLSRVEAGRLEVDPEAFDPCQELVATLEMARQLIELRSAPIRVELDDFAAPRKIVADRQLYTRVVSNLLTNAVRYTESGWVTLRIEEDARRFHTVVEDTGVGLSEEQLEFIFQPFRQVAGAKTRQGGTGLGLTISARLAKLMGGELGVESTPGEGTTFTLTLPLVGRRTQPLRPVPA
jgi:signal transduction histidine kinase